MMAIFMKFVFKQKKLPLGTTVSLKIRHPRATEVNRKTNQDVCLFVLLNVNKALI